MNSVVPFDALACPLDGGALFRDGAVWRCARGHSFDTAAHGYTHLLPVHHKRSRDPGDSREMVACRRRFLNRDYYQPIAAAVARAVIAGATREGTIHCLDAGCGEGYYLRQLAAESDLQLQLALVGLDISKWAVMAAAKQDRRIQWLVGSNANLPILSGTLDCVLCLFGFPVFTEFARVLAPGGLLVKADAGGDHLRELRELIYPSIKPERAQELSVPAGFLRSSTENVRYRVQIDSHESLADLLAMTPHQFRATPEGRARLAAQSSLVVTVDVALTCFARDTSASKCVYSRTVR